LGHQSQLQRRDRDGERYCLWKVNRRQTGNETYNRVPGNLSP
jgi:hypothetical protein